MNESILTQPDVPIYLFMIGVAIFTCLLLASLLVILAKGPAIVAAVSGWCRRTFTDPRREIHQAEVISYGQPVPEVRERQRLRGLVEIQRSTRENVVYADFEARRRLAAKLAFDEIDLDLDEQAVN